jgi:predicted HicB family RNase H-like nuclease
MIINDKTLNVKIPESLYNKLKEEANIKNISLASLVRMLCSEYFNKKQEK